MTTSCNRVYIYVVTCTNEGLTIPYNLISAEPSGWSPEFADIKWPRVSTSNTGLVFFYPGIPGQGNIVLTQLKHLSLNEVGLPHPMQKDVAVGPGFVSRPRPIAAKSDAG